MLSGNKNLQDLITITNSELDKVSVWFKANKLSLNLKKTHFILFGHKSTGTLPLLIKIDGINIEQVYCTKFLGVHIDSKLTWQIHSTEMAKKVARGIGVLYKIRAFVPQDVLISVYYSLVYSHLSYCNMVWGNAALTYLSPLFILQKKAVRIITNSHYRAHTDPLFNSLKLLKVFDIYKLQICLFIYSSKIFNASTLGNNYYSHFVFPTIPKPYDTRSSAANLQLNHSTTNIRKYSILNSGPLIWNALPDDLKTCTSIWQFKSRLKCYLYGCYVTS
jgi:hypothetical protein